MTKTAAPHHCLILAEQLLTAPQTLFKEKQDPENNKSALVGQQKILKERARKHSRDIEMDDLIQNNEKDLAFQNNWLNKDGKKRKAIDDL